MKKELIQEIAKALHSYGYRVYISSNGEYGFYTDGTKVVSFGGHWNLSVDFSGNYQSKHSGTGWQIANEQQVPTKSEAESYLQRIAPHWAPTENVTYTTPEQHLKTYGRSSGYSEYMGSDHG